MNNVRRRRRIDAKLEEHQLLCGSCPDCGHKFQAKPDWVGLPAGVKFDPTDQELIEHLEAKVETTKNIIINSHPLIDEFILTIQGEDGICYTHPQKLPGVTRDGLSRHFFHRPSKAYTTGTRKRRKIQTECHNNNNNLQQGGETRWHKTGKTRPVMVNGKQKGCKKILVLYTNFGKNRKPEKTNWVMHQYHLGQNEEEREGELVVSKIFYQTQPRQCNWSSNTTTTITGEPSSSNNNIINGSRRESECGSCSSSKEIVTHRILSDAATGVLPPPNITVPAFTTNTSATAFDHTQHLQSHDHFTFIPFAKTTFHDHQVGIGEVSTAREVLQASGSCEEVHEQQQQQKYQHGHQRIANSTTDFHTINRPTNPVSNIISPPPIHHTSIILDDNSYHVSTLMLQNQNFQQQHDDHKLAGGRSASGLEEVIMGCTSTDHTKDKEEESSNNTMEEEAEWLKYSSYWPDPAAQ